MTSQPEVTRLAPAGRVTSEPTVNRWGQYLIDGVAHQRVTTLAGMLEARHNLEAWKVRMVGRGFTLRQDLIAKLAATADDEKAACNAICEQALEAAQGSAGANMGDALHTMTARVDLGEDFRPPPPWDRDIAAYQTLLEQADIMVFPAYVERTVVLPEWKVAGTFDRIVHAKGRHLIADLKTGRDLAYSWGAIAIQLACYAHAAHIWDWNTNTAVPMPQVDQKRALVIHLPVGTGKADLYVVNLEVGWEGAQRAIGVKEWRTRDDFARPARLNGKA